jgi:ATP-dependent Clp protease adapter protein ClpS
MNWTAVDFTVGALFAGCALYLPFFLWFRLRRPRAGVVIAHDLEVSLHLVFVAARKQRYETVTTEQLLLALLDNPSAADVLRACSMDLAAMRGSVSALVRATTPVAAGTAAIEPEASPAFQRVLQRAIIHSQSRGRLPPRRRQQSKASSWLGAMLKGRGGLKGVDGADLLATLLAETEGAAVEELRRLGLTRLSVTSVIAHGIPKAEPVPAPARDAAATGAMAVVFVNDDFTPMEFVVEQLQQHVGLDLESAVRVMLEIHHEGRAVAGRFAAEVALDKAARVQAAASQAGHPLRCVVEAR